MNLTEKGRAAFDYAKKYMEEAVSNPTKERLTYPKE